METIAIGDVIAGKYRIEREIGRGGMGVVFAALHIDLDQPIAVKILHEYAAYDQAAISRLLREARAAAKISSSHVVRVMDVGAFPEGGAYIAMELLEGRDLADILQQNGPIPVAEAVDYLVEVCDAVAAAHAAGIVHRDLKPANLFIADGADGISTIKVLDFGVSKIVPKSGQVVNSGELTQTGQIFGSPNYMSPEQLRSATDVDGRTDIWALGVVFYELVSGKLPFGGASMADVLAAVVRDTPPPLSSICPAVSPELAAIIARCLEKEPNDRFADVVQFAQALAPFASAEKQALIARIKRVIAVRAAAPSRPGSSDLFPTPSRGVTHEKQHTPNMVAVERGARVGAPKAAMTGSGQDSAKSYRYMPYGIAVILFVAIAVVASQATTSRPAAPVAHDTAAAVSAAPVPSIALAPVEPIAPVAAVRSAEPVSSAVAVQNKVKIEFSTKPEKVQVYRDNVLLGTTPLSLEFDRSRTSLKLVFNAWGYRSREVTIVPETDRAMVVELAPAGAVKTKDPKTGEGRLPGDLEPF